MTSNGKEWNPLDPHAWARALGLVHVPMFGSARGLAHRETLCAADGDASSFAHSVSDDSSLAYENEPLSWAWSANLRHSLIINERSEEMFLRRWDTPSGTVRKFRLAKNPRAASDFLELLQKSPTPRVEDVVLFVLVLSGQFVNPSVRRWFGRDQGAERTADWH